MLISAPEAAAPPPQISRFLFHFRARRSDLARRRYADDTPHDAISLHDERWRRPVLRFRRAPLFMRMPKPAAGDARPRHTGARRDITARRRRFRARDISRRVATEADSTGDFQYEAHIAATSFPAMPPRNTAEWAGKL